MSEPVQKSGFVNIGTIVVYNDGDSTGLYEMQLALNETQPQHKPGSRWVTFSPKKFQLDPSKSQIVNVGMNVPDYTSNGEYFAFVEAQVILDKNVQNHQLAIGEAAAAKLAFTVSMPTVPKPSSLNTAKRVIPPSEDGLGRLALPGLSDSLSVSNLIAKSLIL